MHCTLVLEQNAGEAALYNPDGRKVAESEAGLTNWNELDHGCTSVTSRFAITEGDGCAIYQCDTIRIGLEPVDYDCITVWPEQLDESWLRVDEGGF